MRLNGLLYRSTGGRITTPALFSAVCLLGALVACGGGDKTAADTTASAATPAESTTAAAPGAPAATATGTAKPITGKTVDVKMIGDAKGYRFEPADFTVKVGDGAKFTNITGGPHDVTFWPDSIPAGAAAQLSANMEKTMAPLTGELLTTPNQTYTVSFAGLPPGVYHYYCTPHLALGMKGTITVQ
ncbi:MAG: plastocyanin/azurin family copper-binding protein [Gemmatimonadaceae bacterium]